jgi:hypothetical protein
MTDFEVTGFRYNQRLDSNNLCICVLNILFFVRTAIKTRGYIKANNGLIKLRTKAKYNIFVRYPLFAEPLLTMECHCISKRF